MEYIKPEMFCLTKKQIIDFFRCSETCDVKCTYMYAYCGDAEGWGTTYCPEWSQS